MMLRREIIKWWRGLSGGGKIALCLLLVIAAASFYGFLHWEPGLEKAKQRIIDRIASGKPVPYHYYFPVWGFYGVVINCSLALVMTGLVAWWGRLDRRKAKLNPCAPILERMGKTAFYSALLAMVVAAYLNAPRLRFSLWGDEDHTVKDFAVGNYRYNDQGSLIFRPVSWRSVFFNYKEPNNHILFTAAVKLSHDLLFRPSNDPRRTYFSEWIIRLPAFLAGLLSIPVLAWLVHLMGFPRAASWVPWLLIGHAWFTRYGSDARGYALLLLLVPLLAALGLVAVRTGLWRWWIGVGVTSAAALLAYPGALYWVVLIQMVIFCLLFKEREGRIERIGRWMIVQVIAGMFFLQLFIPCLPQMATYMKDQFATETGCDTRWVINELAYLATGDAWFPWEIANPFSQTLREQLGTKPLRVGLGLGVLTVILITGMARMFRRPEARLWASAFLLGAIVAVLHAISGDRFLYSWYLMPTFPMISVLLSVGVSGVSSLVQGWRGAGIGVVLVVLIWQPSGLRNQLLRAHPVEPLRESVEVYREILNPAHPDYGKEVMSVAVQMFTEAYDPGAFRVRNKAGLLEKMAASDATGVPLYVNTALIGLGVQHLPEIFAVLHDPQRFETIGPVWGLWAPCSRTVFRYLGSGGREENLTDPEDSSAVIETAPDEKSRVHEGI